MIEELASYQHCVERIRGSWPEFRERREGWLAQQERFGKAAEKAAESILDDLFTSVLDWEISDLNYQVGYADLLLTSLGIKYLIVEAKRPGALAWNRQAVEAALSQARRYADEQKVRSVAVSDGYMLYAADVADGGLVDRAFVSLDAEAPQEALWWLSVHGIYRPPEEVGGVVPSCLPDATKTQPPAALAGPDDLLHPKYHVPARCFAYVGDARDPGTWKLPYRKASGKTDTRRLPKAIQAVISNYRGEKVSGIPEPAVPGVLVRLARAAREEGKMPDQGGSTAATYEQLHEVLDQLGKLGEVEEGA